MHVKVMLKIVERTMIDKEMNGLRACFEPQRLGVATPDGHIVATSCARVAYGNCGAWRRWTASARTNGSAG